MVMENVRCLKIEIVESCERMETLESLNICKIQTISNGKFVTDRNTVENLKV